MPCPDLRRRPECVRRSAPARRIHRRGHLEVPNMFRRSIAISSTLARLSTSAGSPESWNGWKIGSRRLWSLRPIRANRSTRRAVRWMHAATPGVGLGTGAPPLRGPLAVWRRHNRQSFLRSLDGIIAYSQRGAEEYRQIGLHAEQVFVAPCSRLAAQESPRSDRFPSRASL